MDCICRVHLFNPKGRLFQYSGVSFAALESGLKRQCDHEFNVRNIRLKNNVCNLQVKFQSTQARLQFAKMLDSCEKSARGLPIVTDEKLA